MAVYSYITIDLPEAKRLADLAGISNDLRSCIQHLHKFINGFPHHPDLESYSTTLIIKYTRCFSRGVRSDAQIELKKVAMDKDAPTHELICGIRDRHVAHSVSDLESHAVRVWLNPPERGKAVNNVNIETVQYVTIGQEAIQLLQLAEHLMDWVQAEMRKEEAKLTELVRGRFNLDDLYSGQARPISSGGYANLLSEKARKGP
jgi:hypothetical protein